MNYEIVHLKEKIVAGITIRTNKSLIKYNSNLF